MSLLDSIYAKNICVVDDNSQYNYIFGSQLDPKRFDMCIVMIERDKGSEFSRFIKLLSHIEYISSGMCDDYEICRFNYDEIMSQQIGLWLVDNKYRKLSDYNSEHSFYIIQFTAKKMRYAKFIAVLTSLWKRVENENNYKMHLFWSVGGGFLGDYRWKMINRPQLFHGIWKIILWDLTSDHYYNEAAEFFMNTVSHKKDDDLEAYGKRCISLIRRMQTSHINAIERINKEK